MAFRETLAPLHSSSIMREDKTLFVMELKSLLCPDKNTRLGLVLHDEMMLGPGSPESLEE